MFMNKEMKLVKWLKNNVPEHTYKRFNGEYESFLIIDSRYCYTIDLNTVKDEDGNDCLEYILHAKNAPLLDNYITIIPSITVWREGDVEVVESSLKQYKIFKCLEDIMGENIIRITNCNIEYLLGTTSDIFGETCYIYSIEDGTCRNKYIPREIRNIFQHTNLDNFPDTIERLGTMHGALIDKNKEMVGKIRTALATIDIHHKKEEPFIF